MLMLKKRVLIEILCAVCALSLFQIEILIKSRFILQIALKASAGIFLSLPLGHRNSFVYTFYHKQITSTLEMKAYSMHGVSTTDLLSPIIS